MDATTDALSSHRTPEELIALAEAGLLSKDVLCGLLRIDRRRAFLEACARIEAAYTERCAAARDPCLESGCSLEGEGEICLQPLLNAGSEYYKACGAEWVKLFLGGNGGDGGNS